MQSMPSISYHLLFVNLLIVLKLTFGLGEYFFANILSIIYYYNYKSVQEGSDE